MDRSPVAMTRVPVEVPTRWPDGRTNAYRLGPSPTLLVDPPAVDPALSAVVDDSEVDHIAVTHTHLDHVGAVAHYARRSGATVWARAGRTDRFVEATGIEPDRTFREGTVVGPATVIETPGHAPDHVAFRTGETAVVGDLAVARGSVVVGGTDGDMRAYLTSLRRLRAARLGRLDPGHGPPIDDPSATLGRLLAHRRDREVRVIEAVRRGERTLVEVTAAAYEKELTGVADLAEQTVAAHLEKLARAGRIHWDGNRATPA